MHAVFTSWCAFDLSCVSWSWNMLWFMATERIWIRYHPWTVNFTVLVIDEFRKSAPNKDRISYYIAWTVSDLSLRPSRTVRQKLSRLTLTHENQFSSSVNSISSFSSCYQRNKNLPKKNINTRRDRKLKIMLSEKRPSCEVLYSSDFVDELSQAGFHINVWIWFYWLRSRSQRNPISTN